MGILDNLFSPSKRRNRSDLEVLDDIENALKIGEVERAIRLTDEVKSEPNTFLALRMIIRSIIKMIWEQKEDPGRVRELLRGLIPPANSLFTPRYRALVLGDMAVLFYLLGDELNGDIALKTAIEFAGDNADTIRDILMNLLKYGLLEKAGYAMKRVREPETLDVVLVNLARLIYSRGEKEKAWRIVDHISTPFHRAMALYYLAEIEGGRNREEALRILNEAFRVVDEIEEPEAKVEVAFKLYDLKHHLLDSSLDIRGILSGKEAPPQ
ncbi:hypothetical protein A3L12_06190 [Thermococcus sp. P6]|uniref:hypothetical protein n=1 Tax=Thermococcus sp. P6 TaxID=122420 RepID=UPI000B59BF46|nr:hypothetical protein [Thermococcus sp. P6]ASJ10918.1 hypothetical protein A3L12_06190 [Thermococcus sp. P6]